MSAPHDLEKAPSNSHGGSSDAEDYELEKAAAGSTLPIDWPASVKSLVLAQVVVHAFMASWCAAAFIPAFVVLSKKFHLEIPNISYLVGVYTLFLGFGALLWNAVSEKIGRRPVFLIALVISIAASCGAAAADTYGGLMTARVFQGFGMSAPCGIGAGLLKEMYRREDWGKALGIWTLALTTGPFLSPIAGGYLTQYSDYRWAFWLQPILLGAVLLWELVALPETLPSAPGYRPAAYFLQRPWGGQPIVTEHSPRPLQSLAKTWRAVFYAPAWIAGLAFSVPYGFVAVSMSSLFPVTYHLRYHYDTGAASLFYLPLLIGSVLAELVAGPLGDRLVRTPDGRVIERRLWLAQFGGFAAIAGLVWWGYAVEHLQHFLSPAFASGLAAFGVQILTSVVFSYAIESRPPSAKEVAAIMNIFRVLSSFVVLFYNDPLVDAAGFTLGLGAQAIMTAGFTTGGLTLLMIWGPRLRGA